MTSTALVVNGFPVENGTRVFAEGWLLLSAANALFPPHQGLSLTAGFRTVLLRLKISFMLTSALRFKTSLKTKKDLILGRHTTGFRLPARSGGQSTWRSYKGGASKRPMAIILSLLHFHYQMK